uniref:NAC domain-containing protein n=1 Tax=Kalanchoe fedtschenkoi TaxID=63787 RepID=A0A7N0UMZ9_KALFE
MSTGPTWLVDGHRIATKIKSAAGASDLGHMKWKSNPCRACPNCQYIIDNSDVPQDWPGLPRGVKFDPTDQEIIHHLLAKCGIGNLKAHPFINEFIPTVNKEDGICYTHPQNLPGVKLDGSVAHFFHRAIKAYNTGSRKRRKIQGDSSGDVRWHKTGRTKPVMLDGVQKGCKKIMVLYISPAKGGKAEKTNWVMHQYHLGTEEDEKDGECVISKIFYQQQPGKASDGVEQEISETSNTAVAKVDPVTPRSAIPVPPRTEARDSDLELVEESALTQMEPLHQGLDTDYTGDLDEQNESEAIKIQDQPRAEGHSGEGDAVENNDNPAAEDPSWWEESPFLLNSQQLAEGLAICDDLLQSQSPGRQGFANPQESKGRPRLADYSRLGPENLKKDLEECQTLEFDPTKIELDALLELHLSQDIRLSQDFRLSQLEFCSQDSFCAFGGNKVID